MNSKILILFALLISTTYIYYTVQHEKDRIYKTLYQESNKTSKSVSNEKVKVKIKTVTVKESNLVVKSSKKIILQPKKEKEPVTEVIIEEKTSISKEDIPSKANVETETTLESTIAAALKGINTSKIINIEER